MELNMKLEKKPYIKYNKGLPDKPLHYRNLMLLKERIFFERVPDGIVSISPTSKKQYHLISVGKK